ncbi:MAG: hypothetical protein LBP54_00465 [Campylobacteraceae bacterium]|jgi:predicted transcriptional regulator|nr:hypothetical protein [Campylobacteraceae bacterium]
MKKENKKLKEMEEEIKTLKEKIEQLETELDKIVRHIRYPMLYEGNHKKPCFKLFG